MFWGRRPLISLWPRRASHTHRSLSSSESALSAGSGAAALTSQPCWSSVGHSSKHDGSVILGTWVCPRGVPLPPSSSHPRSAGCSADTVMRHFQPQRPGRWPRDGQAPVWNEQACVPTQGAPTRATQVSRGEPWSCVSRRATGSWVFIISTSKHCLLKNTVSLSLSCYPAVTDLTSCLLCWRFSS